MKFGDKLIELRKKNGYSQEELAEKLGVSRQSVSKWESNNTYPETDKIVQIANLFDCSMDDLINEKVSNVETNLGKKKNNFNNIIDSFLDFITSTVNMFSKMTFGSGLKCVIEFIILAFILYLVGITICGISSHIISNLFSFISMETVSIINKIVYGLFNLVWFIVAVIILIHTFKIRYLNYYVDEEKSKIIKENNKNNNPESEKVVEEKIIVRDERDKPFEFLGVLSKIVIFIIKVLAFCILLSFVSINIALVISLFIVFYYIFTNFIFFWIFLAVLSSCVISLQITYLLICFIFNIKTKLKLHLIIFIISIVVFGLGIAFTALSFKNIEIIKDNSIFNITTEEKNLTYKDNLVVKSSGGIHGEDYKYVIDNNIENGNIIVSREIDKKYFSINISETTMDNIPVINVYENGSSNFKNYYNLFINGLKKNKIYSFSNYGNDPLVIKANEETINNLINNIKKLYLVEESREDNTINVSIKDDKVFFKNGLIGKYNALDDSLTYEEENYSCIKNVEVTNYGEKFIYECDFNYDD